jgi:integrase
MTGRHQQRHQTGYIFQSASGSFHIRYYSTEIVNGQPVRVQKSHLLCRKDARHFSKSCKAVRLLAEDFMRTVNTGSHEGDLRIADFWETTYLPFVKQNMKSSTVTGYEQIWNQHLKAHFNGTLLSEYKTHLASAFLYSLTTSQGRQTLNHIRSLMSGIFSHAVNMGLITVNPMTGCRILGKVRPPKPTEHYTLEEAENIISALVDRVDAQLVVALAFFAGLRPSEIAGLQWADFSIGTDGTGTVSIRRAVVRGVVGTCKTPESVATLPLLLQVVVPLLLWKEQCVRSGLGTQTWLFENSRGRPADLKEMVRSFIRPTVVAAGLVWKGLYAGRRGAATAVIGLTNGNVAAAQELLRHKNMATTLAFYKKQTAGALAAGLKALGAAAGESTTKSTTKSTTGESEDK